MDLLQQKLAELIQTYRTVQKDLEFLRSFLEITEEQRNQNEELQAIWSRVMEVVDRAELEIDWTLVGTGWTTRVAGEISPLKREAQVIYGSISCGDEIKRPSETVTRMPSQVTATMYNQDLVGFQEEVKTITCRLTSRLKKLDVVHIVGMPGLGKTTLANAVYSSPSVMSHFHIRAWCTVSQEYSNHNLLVQILCSFNSGNPDQYLEMDEGGLAKKLYQVLLRNRHLLVLDDLWDVEAWNFLQRVLPDKTDGSRVLITSRLRNLSLSDSKAHYLRHLTEEESWELLQNKLVGKGHLAKLSGFGLQIAKSCGGLPLTIVLVAGILATTAEDCLEKIAKSLTSSSVLEDKSCIKTLELSYSHLSKHLKLCLLYFGVFQEDENIPVRRLLWLWISEEFVPNTEGKSLEDVADDFLKDLVDRSLVMVSKERTIGGVKACRIHDLVHEFCIKKAREENFLHIFRRGKDLSCLTDLSKPVRRVCDQNASNSKILEIMPPFPELRSLLLFKNSGLMPKKKDLGSKLLEVLDLGNLVFDAYFPMEVIALVDLRYLALHIGGIESVPSAIGNLERLQTFLVRGNSRNTLLPETIWNIKTLRHLCTTSSSYGFTFPVENLDQLDTLTLATDLTDQLDQLDALTLAIDPNSQSLQKILAKVPSIRRLKCFSDQVTRNCNTNLAFDCLSQLQSLSLHRFDGCRFEFPLNLKKLTLSSNGQPWSEISTIGNLPNLEVLKLLHGSFVGEEWKMKEEEFPNLQVLKLFGLQFRSWTATSDDHFPSLKNLVVQYCGKLKELPDCLAECHTLDMIQVSWCRMSVLKSVKQIQEKQGDNGNVVLKIVTECFDYGEEEEEEEEEEEVVSTITITH